MGYAVAASEVAVEVAFAVVTGMYEEIMVDGFIMVVVTASLLTVKASEEAGTTTVLEVSTGAAVEETSGVGVGVAELTGAADEGLTRRGVSLLTIQFDASSV